MKNNTLADNCEILDKSPNLTAHKRATGKVMGRDYLVDGASRDETKA